MKKTFHIEISNSCGECKDFHWAVIGHHNEVGYNAGCGIEKTIEKAAEEAIKAFKKKEAEEGRSHC